MSTYGTLNQVKSRLVALVKLAIPEYGCVTGDWRVAMDAIYSPKTGPRLPVITIRISPARVVPSFYGRIWYGATPESGDVGLFSFTAHCFHSACSGSGCEKAAHAHNIAERVTHYLNTQDWNSLTEPTGNVHDSYSIGDVFDLSMRESEPKQGARRICRVIIEGTMLVRRVD